MKNNKKKVIISAILAISMCFSLIAGATYALFTSEAKVNIAVTAATVNVAAKVDEETIKLYSIGKEQTGTFENGGTATYDEDTAELTLTNVTPGDKVTFNLVVTNNSNVKIQYRIRWSVNGELKEALVATADGKKIENGVSDWTALDIPANKGETITVVPVSVELPLDAGDKYQGKEASILFTVEAVQGNGPLWNGTADTSWYNDTDTEFKIDSAEQLAGLAELVDGGNNFAGKTIKLVSDINLYMTDANGEPISFEPLGSLSENKAFQGTFDGQGHTISNMYQNGWALANGLWDGPEYGMGFFSLVENATIKNINFDGASLPSEANIMGVVAGGAANCVFENINITDAYLGNHSWYSGGVVGWAEGDIKLTNCDIDADSVVSSQWGDFNNANGGLIGGIDPSSEIYLKDCDVACVIDAYNDVTSAYEWYSYRSCGMLIGDTGQKDDPDGNDVGNAIAPNLTCENVTVTYGEWANYHYCEFGSSGYPFCRVEAGESTGAYGNARVGEYTDANGNKVVDDNHVHDDGEKHNELIVFDQLYGGTSGDRYCTYGTATHPGVKVKYTVSSNDEFAAAIKDGKAIIKLVSGNYIIPDEAQGKELTIIGNGVDTVIATQDDGSYEGCDYSLDGATVTFEGITINTDSTTYTGYARCNATYNNCVINGTYTLYGDSVFNDCTFNVTGDVYNIWTWGAPTATFNNCTFNSDGKALLLYGTVDTTKLTLNDCTFNDNGGLPDLKAAIEIGNDYNKSYELIVNNTTVNGYEINDKGINTGTTLWGNKNSMGTDKLNVVVDGKDVY